MVDCVDIQMSPVTGLSVLGFDLLSIAGQCTFVPKGCSHRHTDVVDVVALYYTPGTYAESSAGDHREHVARLPSTSSVASSSTSTKRPRRLTKAIPTSAIGTGSSSTSTRMLAP
jgi:hypothetical protein